MRYGEGYPYHNEFGVSVTRQDLGMGPPAKGKFGLYTRGKVADYNSSFHFKAYVCVRCCKHVVAYLDVMLNIQGGPKMLHIFVCLITSSNMVWRLKMKHYVKLICNVQQILRVLL